MPSEVARGPLAHGCHAGRQQEACDEVYTNRIQRGKEAFSTKKLGAISADLGAVACFFDPPWNRCFWPISP
ncbi:MAG: hypothetical protein ABJC13_08635 [Acidobacteriota bacterium]